MATEMAFALTIRMSVMALSHLLLVLTVKPLLPYHTEDDYCQIYKIVATFNLFVLRFASMVGNTRIVPAIVAAFVFVFYGMSIVYHMEQGNFTNMTFNQDLSQNPQQQQQPQNDYPFAFAACLIARDDNLLLPEWIAYHYTTLPLRHLILAADPLSITSPMSIVQAFRKELPDLTIEVWTGNSYYLDGRLSATKFAKLNPYNHTNIHAYQMHLHRQKVFYTRCLQKLKKDPNHNHTWTVLLDSDEYFTYNYILPHEQKKKKTSEQTLRKSLPSKIGKQNETIAHWIANEHRNNIHNSIHNNSTTCVSYPRFFFSANDNITTAQQEEQLALATSLAKQHATDDADDSLHDAFHTLRYRGRWPVGKQVKGKSIVNVDTYNGRDSVKGCHVVLPSCRCFPHVVTAANTPFRVHHYSGSLESYLSSPRRSSEAWLWKNNFQIQGHDDSMSGWLHHFVELVGEKAAYRLTLELVQAAFEKAETIKYRVEFLNETIPLAFEYDKPGDPLKIL